MTPETRTIDLSVLATELGAEGWVEDEQTWMGTYFVMPERSNVPMYDQRRTLLVCPNGQTFLGYQQRDNHDRAQWIVLAAMIEVTHPVWQSALGIVQRHVAATGGAQPPICGICLQPLTETDTHPGRICRSCWASAFPAESYVAGNPATGGAADGE